MAISISPGYRAAAIGVASAALLVGAFTIGAGRGDGSSAQAATRGNASSGPARITVTGTGTVTGTPNQLMLSMGVQVNGASVSSALTQANQAVVRVTAALRQRGVAATDIQTSGLSIYPNYRGNSQVPVGYGVSESLTATLNNLSAAGSQIQAAVQAGGNATTVDNVSLNLTDDGALLATARANAVHDAHAKAAQFARALGEPLGQVISVSSADQNTPIPFAGQASAAKASPVPISPGSQQVSVSVTVVYAA
ncbi:MAG TPA: SIMPL domain-containing protein [Streptosporangiaceae bacterium]|nr:SIMPL domain-containing protein [Streptosporangiaceae bacterium]